MSDAPAARRRRGAWNLSLRAALSTTNGAVTAVTVTEPGYDMPPGSALLPFYGRGCAVDDSGCAATPQTGSVSGVAVRPGARLVNCSAGGTVSSIQRVNFNPFSFGSTSRIAST